jgi:hypothetical protein
MPDPMLQSEIIVSLITLSGILALAWMSPGPNMLAVIDSSLRGGWGAGFATGLGISTGNVVWASVAVAGSDALFEQFPQVIVAVQALGCAYLLYLADRDLHQPQSDPLFRLCVHSPDPTGCQYVVESRGCLAKRCYPRIGTHMHNNDPVAAPYGRTLLCQTARDFGDLCCGVLPDCL